MDDDAQFPWPQRPTTPAALNAWIRDVLGHHIPARAVCPDHDAPLDFVAALFFDEVSDALVLANRAGGKTEDFAALHLANAYWKPGHETSHIGAVEIQAKRCYAYYKRGLRHATLKAQAPDPHIGSTEWENGSRIEILPGTEAQTQGGHPQIVIFDELEQAKYQPYENAKGMPVEWMDAAGVYHPGQFVAGSTRQSSLGMMQRALDEAVANGIPIFSWCVLETIKGSTCRDEQGAPLCEGCPLWEDCEGKALAADGWRSRNEIIRLKVRSGADTWEAQHLCRKPEAKALIYAPFTTANVTPAAEYVPGAGPVFIGGDWGYTEPAHLALVQYRDAVFVQFDELSGSGRSEREWVREVVKRLMGLPGYDGPQWEEWERIWARQQAMPVMGGWWPALVVCDPSAPQLRTEFAQHGFPVANPDRVRHEVLAGQDVTRAAIATAAGVRRFFVQPRCVTTIEALGRYRARKLADGSYDPKPDPDPANHAYSHPTDAVRYLFWRLRALLGFDDPHAMRALPHPYAPVEDAPGPRLAQRPGYDERSGYERSRQVPGAGQWGRRR